MQTAETHNHWPIEIPTKLEGTFRQFGEAGPVYEVLELVTGQSDAKPINAKIRVLHSGEILYYDIRKLLLDPSA